jgi:hypothetical protein
VAVNTSAVGMVTVLVRLTILQVCNAVDALTLHLEVDNRFVIIKSGLFILSTVKTALVHFGERLVIQKIS